jgi:hypothetical protein
LKMNTRSIKAINIIIPHRYKSVCD